MNKGQSVPYCAEVCRDASQKEVGKKDDQSKTSTYFLMHFSGQLSLKLPDRSNDSVGYLGMGNVALGPQFRLNGRENFRDSAVIGLLMKGSFGSQNSLSGAINVIKFMDAFGFGIDFSVGGDVEDGRVILGGTIFATLCQAWILSGLTLMVGVDHYVGNRKHDEQNNVRFGLGWSIVVP